MGGERRIPGGSVRKARTVMEPPQAGQRSGRTSWIRVRSAAQRIRAGLAVRGGSSREAVASGARSGSARLGVSGGGACAAGARRRRGARGAAEARGRSRCARRGWVWESGRGAARQEKRGMRRRRGHEGARGRRAAGHNGAGGARGRHDPHLRCGRKSLVATVLAASPGEPVGEDATAQVGAEVLLDPPRNTVTQGPRPVNVLPC